MNSEELLTANNLSLTPLDVASQECKEIIERASMVSQSLPQLRMLPTRLIMLWLWWLVCRAPSCAASGRATTVPS